MTAALELYAIELEIEKRKRRRLAANTIRPYYNGTLKQFATEVNPRFKWYRHVEILGELLEQVVSGDLKRLMIFEPPRHGKTLLASKIFPAYALAKRPEWWLGLCAYEATLAQDYSRIARDNYLRAGGELRGDSTAVNLWQTSRGGGLWASGVGGPITGRGFNIGCIDDPLKNSAEADSLVKRTSQQRWYESTFFTRAEPGAAILLTMTRWHEADLAGWLLSQELEEPEHWTIVSLPAIKDDQGLTFPVTCNVIPDWRKDGEALCPERYDAEALTKIMRVAGPRVTEALYQQRPSPDSGTIFKREWWNYWTIPEFPIAGCITVPELDYQIQSWDMSFKDTDSSDYVSGQVWGLNGAKIFLLDRINERLSFSGSCIAMRTMSAKWPNSMGKYVEDKANGSAIINALTRDVLGIVPVEPDGGKVARAYAVQALVQAGNVYLPHPSIAPWVEDFVRQLAGFPNTAHDDDVDACTQALNQLAWTAREKPAERLEYGDDQHPGFDYKAKKRRPKTMTVPDPNGDDSLRWEDDLRPNLFRVPRTAQGSAWRMPRPNDDEDYE